jgi:hypothetical protein
LKIDFKTFTCKYQINNRLSFYSCFESW